AEVIPSPASLVRAPENDLIGEKSFQEHQNLGDYRLRLLFNRQRLVVIGEMPVSEVSSNNRQLVPIIVNLNVPYFMVFRGEHRARRRRSTNPQAPIRKTLLQLRNQYG